MSGLGHLLAARVRSHIFNKDGIKAVCDEMKIRPGSIRFFCSLERKFKADVQQCCLPVHSLDPTSRVR